MQRLVPAVLIVLLAGSCGGETTDGTAPPPDTTGSTATTASTTSAPDPTVTTPPPEEPAPPASSTTVTTVEAEDSDITADTVETTSTTTSTTTTTTTIPEPELPPSPLTGLGVENAELLERRTIAVKVDNHWDARPQVGIGEAETVLELLVESGITRFIALFHTTDATVGPVRSVRPTDPHLLRHFNATLLTSGGQDWIINTFPRNNVGVIGEIKDGPGFREPTRQSPHNYIVNTADSRPVANQRLYPDTGPPPLFEFGDLPPASLGGVTQVNMEWAPDNLVSWRWNGAQWERHLPDGPHTWTSDGESEEIITADTLGVLFSRLFYTRPPSGEGYSLPTMETTGGGRALVFAESQVVEGRWDRDDTSHPFSLTLPDGSPITVPPGKGWISLFPEGRPVSW